MNEFSLNGRWELRDEPLTVSVKRAASLGAMKQGWIPTPVPGDIHQGLMAAGKIKDPLVGLNSFDCRWTENRSWWFRKTFTTQPGWRNAGIVELSLDGLDSNARIFLNGHFLGEHRNAYYPFVARIEKFLKPAGKNVLLVRLTAGLEEVTKKDIAALGVAPFTEVLHGRPERGDVRRPFARKPQYVFGWDWGPRLATTAIAGDAIIRALDTLAVRDVHVTCEKAGSDVRLKATVTVDWLEDVRSGEGNVEWTLTDPNGKKKKFSRDVFLKAGLNFVELETTIQKPLLWWPSGMGPQHLYTIEVCAKAEKRRVAYPAFQYGIRFIEMETQGTFGLVVNGQPVFCKGANWIPADCLYARVNDETYETLVREAKEANFNMLRVWGGGLYEREAFYRACDRYGIMVWQDFMFACDPYPDYLEAFRNEVRIEAEYQTKRLRNHPSVVLWCGNNENHWFLGVLWKDKAFGGFHLYNYLLPEIVQKNCPSVPYWNSSPYGGEDPNCAEIGDRHHWTSMKHADMRERIRPEAYDEVRSLFVSEYGYLGAPSRDTVRKYCGGALPERNSRVWFHHFNSFATYAQETVDAGIQKHYTDPQKLSTEDFLLYCGLCQGLMYEYSLDTFRGDLNCRGALFWMLNDCWGEVGWTIVDYYLRRKISWYFVKRALAPVRLVLRESQGSVRVVMANDSSRPIRGILEFGRISLDGKTKKLRAKAFSCPPMGRARVAKFKRDNSDPTENLWLARVKNNREILPGILRAADFRNLKIGKPILSSRILRKGKGWVIRVRGDNYVHAVHLELPKGASAAEDYFDLTPGEVREVRVDYKGTLAEKHVRIRSVNDYLSR
ncbi:MAG: beta-mannosidase [Phycisphaerae bacterium]|nr:beta-mannosidase [Phycisphaerae bacterium]